MTAMKVISLVQTVLKFIGASPSLAHQKLHRIYGFFILIVMTANLYAYVIWFSNISKQHNYLQLYFKEASSFQILAFIINSADASLFLQTFAMSMGAFSAVVKSSTLIFSHKTFGTILTGIRDILGKKDFLLCFWQHYPCTSWSNPKKINKITKTNRKIKTIPNVSVEKESTPKQYQKYNKIERNYSQLYGMFMLMSAQTISFGPLLSVLYGVYKGFYHFRYPCEVV